MKTPKHLEHIRTTAIAALGAALLAGCAHTKSFSETCTATCFGSTPPSDFIPVRAGTTPVFAITGSLFIKAVSEDGGSGETDWSSADVQAISDGIAEGLHSTATVETIARPAAALSLARLAGDPQASPTGPGQKAPPGEPAFPEELSAPMLAEPIWGERSTHLVLFQAAIYKEPLKFEVGGAPTVPALFFFFSRRTAMTLSATVFDRATGLAVSHLSLADSIQPESVWVFYFPIYGTTSASPEQILRTMSQRIGEEIGRRAQVMAPSPPPRGEAPVP